jgi:hypothetical protein
MGEEAKNKARNLRLERLRTMVHQRLEQPAAALESLLSELKADEPQPALWEELHGASMRDQKEQELATAYKKVTTPQRLREFPTHAQAQILMHAADFFQGVLGDTQTSEAHLKHVLDLIPGHPEAFARLEKKFAAASNKHDLIELYAKVSEKPPKPADELARTALNAMMVLPGGSALSDEACKQLVGYVPVCVSMLVGLDTHCRKTGRTELAGTLIEQAIEHYNLAKVELTDLRRRLIDIYEDAGVRGKSMPHVEWLLDMDPGDTKARAAAEKLITHREVGARATAAIRQAKKKAPFG